MKHRTTKRCPKCGSHNSAAILWGMPAFSAELEKDIDEGRVVLGGCCVVGDDPDRHCNDCGHEWRTSSRAPKPRISGADS